MEDEAKVARALREGLTHEQYEVVLAPTGEEGFLMVNAEEFDLIILDLMLPGRDGPPGAVHIEKTRITNPGSHTHGARFNRRQSWAR